MIARSIVFVPLAAVAAGAACKNPDKATPAGNGEAQAVPVAIIDAASTALPDAAATVKEHMREHFSAITEIQQAVVRSNLPAAQSAASYLAEHVEHEAIAGWKPHMGALRQAAARVASATDVQTAAVEAANLGRACARCHQAHSAIVTFAWEPEPEAQVTLAEQMRKHQWAAARLWEGVVGPSEQMWLQGATAIAELKLDLPAAQAGDKKVDDFVSTVRTLAKRAVTTEDDDARAALYGELLHTCASCHRAIRDGQPGTPNPSK